MNCTLTLPHPNPLQQVERGLSSRERGFITPLAPLTLRGEL